MLPACLLLVASVSAVSITTYAGVNITSTAPIGNSTVVSAAAGMSTEHQVLTACGVVFCVRHFNFMFCPVHATWEAVCGQVVLPLRPLS